MYKIQIMYICTAKYKFFAEAFFSSLHHFLPEEEKIVTVLTDDVKYISDMFENIKDTFSNNKIYSLDINKITDLPYPLINLSKFYFVKDYINENADFIFYFDADTTFLQKEPYFWKNLFNVLNNNKILVSPSASYVLSFFSENYMESQRPYRIYDMELFKNRCDERESSPLYDKLHIPDRSYVWVTTSFIASNKEIMKNFCDLVNRKTQECMVGEVKDGIAAYHIPRLFDETIVNKLIHESFCGRLLGFDFIVKPYASFKYSEIPDYTFIIQKSFKQECKKHSVWE